MGMIAESAGGFCCAGRDGKIYFKTIGEDEEEIPLNLFKTYKFGEEYQISKVAYEDGIRNYKFGDETRNTLWISQDNIFIVDENQIKNIYDKIKGLTLNSFEGTSIMNPAWDIGDKIIIDGKPIIFQGEMSITNRIISDIKSTINIKSREETTIKKESQKTINRKIKSEIDQVNGKITQLVQETSENTEKLSKHEQTIDSITDTVSKVETNLKNNYYTRTQSDSKITQTAESITSEVNKSITDAKEEVLEQANSKITQTAESITSEVNKKVGNDELGTKIEQNWESIQIAWNKISQYIQFANASLQILDSNNKLLLNLNSNGLYLYDTDGKTNKMILNRQGERFYENGEYIGNIGTNKLKNYESKRGLEFDLDTRGSYMTWACKENSGDDTYIMKLWYARPNTGNLQEGLALGTDLILNNRQINLGNDTYIVTWSNGGAGIKAVDRFTIGDIAGNTFFSIDEGKVNCYKNFDMHGYNIMNAGDVASDGRLKKSIYTSKISAIDRIKQIKHRQFKWKKDNKQEEIGYIAQEMEKIDANYVRHNYKEDNEGNIIQDTYEMRILPILATATKAIQEQQEIIEKQQKQINMLMEKLNIQQDLPYINEEFIEEQETIYDGQVVNKDTEILKEAPKYKTVMKHLENGEVEIFNELDEKGVNE